MVLVVDYKAHILFLKVLLRAFHIRILLKSRAFGLYEGLHSSLI